MRQLAGYWWPETDSRGSAIISRDAEGDVAWVLENVDGRDCIIQAGGNVGVYADVLALHFKHVLTVEPDDENFKCLQANLAVRNPPNPIDARKAAFGEAPGVCKVIQVEANNCGAHRIGITNDETGTVILPIDSFNLNPDAIWLDVEGFELQALKGAVETIERCKPVIILEMKQLGRLYGYDDADTEQFLGFMGYSCVARHGNDKLFKPTGKVS
jgi:FkbM family methyltransferase